MIMKLIGAILVIVSCSGVSLSIALSHKREVVALQRLIASIDRIVNELEYRLTPLPELLVSAANTAGGPVGTFYLRAAQELNRKFSSNAQECFTLALSETYDLPELSRKLLAEMGTTIGQYDADGQTKGLLSVKAQAEVYLSECTKNMDKRLRSYQTLGICAGAAIAILFI